MGWDGMGWDGMGWDVKDCLHARPATFTPVRLYTLNELLTRVENETPSHSYIYIQLCFPFLLNVILPTVLLTNVTSFCQQFPHN